MNLITSECVFVRQHHTGAVHTTVHPASSIELELYKSRYRVTDLDTEIKEDTNMSGKAKGRPKPPPPRIPGKGSGGGQRTTPRKR